MAMVCPQCNTSHEQRLQCPACGNRLIYQDMRRRSRRSPRPAGHWMQGFFGRLVIGLILSQGLYFGLRHLFLGILLASQGEETIGQTLQSLEGMVLLESLLLVPLFLGALLAGSGQRQGFVLGFVLGLFNSVLSMCNQAFLAHQAPTMAWYGQPLLQACCASLGGWLGSAIWKPLTTPKKPDLARLGRKLGGVRRRMSLLAGRVAWFRVSLGALLAVAGSLWAEVLLQAMLNASAGKLETATHFQDQIFTWEIRALAILFGGALAGATTSNGIKQGLCVGVVACLVLLAVPRNSHGTVLVALLTAITTFTLSVAGGWFGSQLLPPVVSNKNKGALRTAP